jgi:hypothetical protein
MRLSSNSWPITSSTWLLNSAQLSQHKSPSWVRDAGSEVEPLIANDVSLKFSGGDLRRVSYTYNLAGVLDRNLLAALAARLLSFRESGRVQ